jgi:hypothetical protein
MAASTRSGTDPPTALCQTQFDQKMYIRRPGNSDYHYVTQVLKTGFTMTEVWSERAGKRQTKNWP